MAVEDRAINSTWQLIEFKQGLLESYLLVNCNFKYSLNSRYRKSIFLNTSQWQNILEINKQESKRRKQKKKKQKKQASKMKFGVSGFNAKPKKKLIINEKCVVAVLRTSLTLCRSLKYSAKITSLDWKYFQKRKRK